MRWTRIGWLLERRAVDPCFAAMSVPAKVALGTFVGLLTSSEKVLGKSEMKAFLIVPWALPLILSVVAWRYVFDPTYGVVN